MSDYSIYPKAIDGYAQIPLVVDKKSPINAESVNRLRSGLINIEKAIGVAPEFSDEYGSFPDFASRIDNLEGQVVSETSLTALYEIDNIIRIDDEPLVLMDDHDAYCGFGFDDGNFVIGSSTGIVLEAKGIIPGQGPVANWPKSVVIKKSEAVLFEEDGHTADLSTYLSFGGGVTESDLLIIKVDPQEDQNDQGEGRGSLVGLMVGVGASMDASLDPVSFSVQCADTSTPGAEGGFIEIQAGGVEHETDTAGSVSIKSGGNKAHNHGDPSQIVADAPGWRSPHGGGPEAFHPSAVRLYGSKRGHGGQTHYPAGAGIECHGGGPGVGGKLMVMAGAGHHQGGSSNDNGGEIVIIAGEGNRGGNVTIISGESSDGGEGPSNIHMIASGGAGIVEVTGHAKVNGSLSLPIESFTSPDDNGGKVFYLSASHFTLSVWVNINDTKVILPDAGQNKGRIYNIKSTGGGLAFNVEALQGDSIDGSQAYTITNQYEMVSLQSNGNEWLIIGSHG
jgi:hypothetical protein